MLVSFSSGGTMKTRYFLMIRSMESQPEEESGDGLQAEDLSRLMEGLNESDAPKSREQLERWEEGQFGNRGESINEDDPVTFI
jgi:hypothetical protein